MKRRDFITLLGGAAATWPIAARGQQPANPLIGVLHNGASETSAQTMAAFRKGLHEAGYVEGQNLTIEFRFADNNVSRLPDLAAELANRGVAVIAALGGLTPAIAAKAATATIPIVFSTGGDPVLAGVVTSLNRPGGNVTGITSISAEVAPKRLGLLNELLPQARRFALLINTNGQNAGPVVKSARKAAATIQGEIDVLEATNPREIDEAFASLSRMRSDAILVETFNVFRNRRVQIVTLASRHAIPAIYFDRDFTDIGGLMSYGPSGAEMHRQAGLYVGRILKGEKPAELPILQASKFELIINAQTARTLGLTIPPMLLATADEVIE